MKLSALVRLLVLAILALPLRGQLNRGIVQGTVTDPPGAVIPGVEVTLTSVESGVATTTKTNDTGYYRLQDLTPGVYRARFVSAGLSPLVLTDVAVLAGKEIRLDAQLKLGEARQTIEVAANVAQIETAPTNYSTTLDSHTVTDIPLAGRDLLQLVFLIPGVNNVGGPPGSNFGFSSQYGTFPDATNVLGSALEVNGGSGGTNAWYLDGSLNVIGVADNAAVNPSPDAVEEFQAITNAFSAEYGHTGGGVFNVVLKSGTNSLHGSAYEYLRNSATNARNPFTSIDSTGHLIPDRVLHFNDFGGTFGGPVYIPKVYNGKNKTFFFFSDDANILHLMGSQVLTVPTARMRTGDFSEVPNITQYGIYNPYSTVGPDGQGTFARSAFGTPITPNGCTGYIDATTHLAVNPTAVTCSFSAQLPGSIPTPNGFIQGLNPTAQYFLNAFPLPNYVSPLSGCPMGLDGFPVCDNFLGTVGSSQVSQNVSLKFDHQWSQKNKWFAEWLYTPGQYRNYRVPWSGPAYPNSSVGYGSKYPTDFTNLVIALGNTYMLSPTLVNEFRASFARQLTAASQGALNQLMSIPQTEKEVAALSIPTSSYYPVPIMNVSLPAGGSLNIGQVPWSNVYQMGEAYTILDNVTKILGKHTLKTGFIYRLEHGAWGGSFPTQLNFYGSLTTDPVTSLGGGGGIAELLMGAVPGGSLGITAPFYERWRYWAGFAQDDIRITSSFTLNLGLRYDLYGYFKSRWYPLSNFCLQCPNPSTGLNGEVIYEGDPEFPKGHDILPSNKTSFAPRLNFAWAPFHGQKTVIRGGYDIFYSDVVNGSNYPGEAGGLSPGWFYITNWNGSYYPNQCAPFSGQCVVFPLTDSTVDRGTLATPPQQYQLPGQRRDPQLGASLYNINKPVRDPMVERWGLEIQRELPANLLLSVGYVGNHGTHLVSDGFRNIDYVPIRDRIQLRTGINSVVPITDYYSGKTATELATIWGSDQLPRSILLTPFPAYSGITQLPAYDGNSIYHGLNVRLQKRLSSGFTFIAAYTFSKKITDPAIVQTGAFLTDPLHSNRNNLLGGRAGVVPGAVYGGTYQDPDNRRLDRGLATDDIPHMFNFASSYELPFGRGKPFLNQSRFLDTVAGGWQLSGTFNAQSGLPLAISGPCDQLTCRPNLIGDTHFPGSRSKAERISQWINPAAFTPPFGTDQNFWANYDPNDPRAYQFGTAGVEVPGLRSPGFWNLDASLSKRFSLTEKRYFQFRWEAFNALNHQNLGFPNVNFCLPPRPNGETDLVHQAGCTFGRITNVQTDPRAMEFALKFVF
jgi:hypothetical protein